MEIWQIKLIKTCWILLRRDKDKKKNLESKGGAVVRALASHQCGPGSNPGFWCHIWVEIVVGSLPCSARFSSGYSGFPNSNLTTNKVDEEPLKVDVLSLNCYYHFYYCTIHKHANSKAQKLPSQLRFSMLSIIIMITRNEPWNTETHKMDRNPPITIHKQWPFEPVKVKFCFLRGLLRWLMAVKNAIISWLLNFRLVPTVTLWEATSSCR